MKANHIVAIDQSTSATKAIIVNRFGEVVAKESKAHRQYYQQPGWVEHDPLEIYENVNELLAIVIDKARIAPNDLRALSIANQRETVVVWDKYTAEPVYNAIVWQCRRTSDMCKQLQEQGLEKEIRSKTGLTLDPYFSATKIKWILDHIDGAKQKAVQGKLLCGTIDRAC